MNSTQFTSRYSFGLFVLLGAVFFATPASAQETYFAVPDGIAMNRILPAIRFGAEYKSSDLDQHKYYARTQTVDAYGEFAFNENVSIAGYLPWTRKKETNIKSHTRFDNLGLGVHGALPGSTFIPVAGLDLTLPTGSEKVGIGSKRIFNIEPYAGLAFHDGIFSITGLAKYNTQSNRRFREDPEKQDDFERTWLANVGLGLNFEVTDLLLEYQYRYTYDPDPKRKSIHTIAPGLNLKVDHFIFSFSVPCALSKQREFDYGVILRAGMRF